MHSVDKNSLRLNFEPANFPSIADGDAASAGVVVAEKPVKTVSMSEMKIPPVSSFRNANASSTMRPNLVLTEGASRLPTSVSTSQM